MPETIKKYLLYIFPLAALIFLIDFMSNAPATHAYEGIETYYIRYDVKSSKNKIIDDNLLMVPAKNDFRAEKFSQITITGVISADQNGINKSNNTQIKDDSLKSVLVKNGLNSITAKDYDTIISYEGVIITPVKIIKKKYNKNENSYSYEVQVKFSPIAFPDQWETLNMKNEIKKTFLDFFKLFK